MSLLAEASRHRRGPRRGEEPLGPLVLSWTTSSIWNEVGAPSMTTMLLPVLGKGFSRPLIICLQFSLPFFQSMIFVTGHRLTQREKRAEHMVY